ncbi:MAG: hypothetical protein PWR21_2187 [Methanoculleus sp.]|nr:hypothetical protein [Methanoculleus sp.]MDK2988959.1 hypothetical protein [Methanoculleus sp.]
MVWPSYAGNARLEVFQVGITPALRPVPSKDYRIFSGNMEIGGASTTIPDCFFCRASKGWLRASGPDHLSSPATGTSPASSPEITLLREAKTLLDERFRPDGYNIGVNVRAAAGQTVMHLHVHVIPRYAGDVADPRGGIRGAVPEKRVY